MLAQSILYHLPVFMTDPWSHPHNFQVALEVELSDTRAPRSQPTRLRIRTVSTPRCRPCSRSPLWSSTCWGTRARARSSSWSSFATNFERAERVEIARTPARIARVLPFRDLAPDLPKPAELAYVMFGSGDSLALAHLLGAPEDFDQILTVEADGADTDMTAGWSLSFPGRSNKVGDRLRVGEEISCETEGGAPDQRACGRRAVTARSGSSRTSSAGSPAMGSAPRPLVPPRSAPGAA